MPEDAEVPKKTQALKIIFSIINEFQKLIVRNTYFNLEISLTAALLYSFHNVYM